MELKASLENLRQVLVDEDRFYQIPNYQRPYSWDEENISDLIYDLTTAFMKSNSKGNSKGNNDSYFCGSLVLVKKSNDERLDIIDGQQRITTFIILACVIRDVYGDELDTLSAEYINKSIRDIHDKNDNKKKLKFHTGKRLQLDFDENIIKKVNFSDIASKHEEPSSIIYRQNARYLRDYLAEIIKEGPIKINPFIHWLYKEVMLTVVICPNEDSAIQIFNVLNDRGKPLSPIDILKSSLMKNLGEEDREIFSRRWDYMQTYLEGAGYELEKMFNSAYLYYKITTNPTQSLHKELLKVFEKEKNSSGEEKNSLEIIYEIDEFSKKYVELLKQEDKYLYSLKYLKHEIYWTSILSTALYVNYESIEELKKYLMAYYYQNWIAGATVNRMKQTSFNILKLVKSNKPIGEITKVMEEYLKSYGTTQTYKDAIKGHYAYFNKWIKPVLILIEYFSTDDSNQSFIPVNSKNRNIQVEHILPQTDNEYWNKIFNEGEREQWVNSLGNLTLLSQRKNIQSQNYPFPQKKEVFAYADDKTTSFLISQDILKYDNWGPKEVEERHNKLLNKVDSIINIF